MESWNQKGQGNVEHGVMEQGVKEEEKDIDSEAKGEA